MTKTASETDTEQAVNGTGSEASDPVGGRARRQKRRPQRELKTLKTFSEYYGECSRTERKFIRLALKVGDTDSAARRAGFRDAASVLGRASVRGALLSAAPFTASHITARLVKPYVLAQLVTASMEGDVQAAKVLLSLDVKQASPSPLVDYTRRPSATDSERRTDSERSPIENLTNSE